MSPQAHGPGHKAPWAHGLQKYQVNFKCCSNAIYHPTSADRSVGARGGGMVCVFLVSVIVPPRGSP